MQVLAGIGVFVSMIVVSVMVWKLIESVVYRLTGKENLERLVALVFIFLMVAISYGLTSAGAKYDVTGARDQFVGWTFGDWIVIPVYYCLGAAVLMVAAFILGTVAQVVAWVFGLFGGFVDAIRGD